MLAIEFDARLVEEAVLAMIRLRRPGAAYWGERDAIYALEDEEERDHAFADLHRRQFEALDLAAPLRRALAELPLISERAQICRVFPAATRRDEGAELFVSKEAAGAGDRATRRVVVRIRAESFAEPESLLSLLRHELYHVADMLDPAFGYSPDLPEVQGGPMRLQLALGRYRVLWDTVIDGRLRRKGQAGEAACEARVRQFEKAFPMLRERAAEAFERWFAHDAPTHEALLRFALDPAASMGLGAPASSSTGICPLCECPGELRGGPGVEIRSEIVRAVQRDFPAWRPEDGACPQCEELYRSRTLTQYAAAALPRG